MLECRSQEGVSMVHEGEGKRQVLEVNLKAWTESVRVQRMWMLSLGFGRSREGRF